MKKISYEPAPVTGYEIHSDGGLIYNPLSREAQKTGVSGKYDGAETVSGSIDSNGYTLDYTMPKAVTAYDVIPIKVSAIQTPAKPSSTRAACR